MEVGLTRAVLLLSALAACAAPSAPPLSRVDADLAALKRDTAARLEAFDREPPRPADTRWVKAKLAVMAETDSFVRRAFFSPEGRGYSKDETRAFMKGLDGQMVALDRRNTADLKGLLSSRDWFTVAEFGPEADAQAWLVVQHADLDGSFQKDVLRRLEPLAAKGQTSPANFAFLFDRVATNEGRLQRYGTQGGCAGPGVWRPNAVEDPARTDERRAAVGLPPLADYVKQSGPGCQ
ncbi:hypothetical protein EPO15_06560 [bacterium]|nr:MAG: hypothetical protein EPO15_06560 [bacterium]